eukprot:SAG31_NODE_2703_length_5220_cov_6.258153_2_plen_740_part_00
MYNAVGELELIAPSMPPGRSFLAGVYASPLEDGGQPTIKYMYDLLTLMSSQRRLGVIGSVIYDGYPSPDVDETCDPMWPLSSEGCAVAAAYGPAEPWKSDDDSLDHHNISMSAWVSTCNAHGSVQTAALVHTNAPVMRWQSRVDSAGTFGYRVDVTVAASQDTVWTSGNVWLGNWPPSSPSFPGLCVYSGPPLQRGATYNFSVVEWQSTNAAGVNVSKTWTVGTGSFTAAADLRSARTELMAELRNPNMTQLWRSSSQSLWSRVEPSGFLPLSPGNGDRTASMYVRDAAGMLVGILELGPTRWPVAQKAARFLLHSLRCTQRAVFGPGCMVAPNLTFPPEVLIGDCPQPRRAAGKCVHNTAIVGVGVNEETDAAFYVIAAWGRVVTVANDTALEAEFYETLKAYIVAYLGRGVAPRGAHSPYWDEQLGLLWNPRLEHSRLSRYWSTYDALTNSFAVEALRVMIDAAGRQEPSNTELIADWERFRARIIHGLHTSLAYAGVETQQRPIYAELRGRVDNGSGFPSPLAAELLFGMSWVQLSVINCLVSNMSSAGASGAIMQAVEGLGILPERLDDTFAAHSMSGSFLWVDVDEPELSALVLVTHINSSRLRTPVHAISGHSSTNNTWCRTVSWPAPQPQCEVGCPCPARVVIGKGLGWETGWATHREQWTRLIALTRWLAKAHHVGAQPLFAEFLDYDCIRRLDEGTTGATNCWGDPASGVQLAWWVWGQALLRRKLGMSF